MASAFVLITCDPGKEDSVKTQLESLYDIKEVSQVHGAYDVIAKLDSDSIDTLQGLVARKIRSMTSVRSALSLPLKNSN